MLNEYIEVQPDPALRVAFACWAVAQDPKVRTVSLDTFAVPYARFTAVPEEVLVGALIDGHLYRHIEDASSGTDGDVEDAAEETVTLYMDAVEDDPFEEPFIGERADVHECTDCGDVFSMASGLKRHRTRKHKE